MNLSDFLGQRERELATEIDQLRSKLVPLESELAQVRRAKAAIGLGVSLSSISHPAEEAAKAAIQRAFIIAQAATGELAIPDCLADTQPSSALLGDVLYGRMTMKELVVKALSEHFHQGATTRQLVDFFRDAWGRDIERTNLSPQISRLYQEGKIWRSAGMKQWHIVPEDRIGKRPFRVLTSVLDLNKEGDITQIVHRAGDIVWLRPEDAPPQYFVPLGESVSDPDPDEDDDQASELARIMADAKLRSVVSGERTPEQQAVLDVLEKHLKS